MKTLILHYNDSIAEKLKAVLATFSQQDLKIEDEKDAQFLHTKKELQEDFAYSQQSDAIFYTIEEVKKKYKISE